jgi:predicted ATPase
VICSAAEGELTKHVQLEGGMGALLWDGSASELETTTVVHTEDGLTAYNLSLSQLGNTSTYEIAEEKLARTGRKPVVMLDRSKTAFPSSSGSMARVSSEDLEDLETMVSLFRTQSWKSSSAAA